MNDVQTSIADAGHPSNSFWVELIGSEVRYRNAGGYRTRSIEAGSDGDTVILLHGISGHAETWARNVSVLARDCRVYAIDMLGHGFTDKPDIDYRIKVLAEHVLAFMDAIGARTAHVVGQSLGGWVAGWLAVHHPERVSSFVSVTGAGLQLTDAGAALTEKVGGNVRSATEKALDQPTREKVRVRLEWLMYDASVVTDELVETRYQVYRQPGFVAVAPRMVRNLTTEIAPDELLTPERLARIAAPVLVFWTQNNPTMPWEVGEAASRIIPEAGFYLMEKAGHWPQFEKSDEFNRVVGSFLRARSGSGRPGGQVAEAH